MTDNYCSYFWRQWHSIYVYDDYPETTEIFILLLSTTLKLLWQRTVEVISSNYTFLAMTFFFSVLLIEARALYTLSENSTGGQYPQPPESFVSHFIKYTPFKRIKGAGKTFLISLFSLMQSLKLLCTFPNSTVITAHGFYFRHSLERVGLVISKNHHGFYSAFYKL